MSTKLGLHENLLYDFGEIILWHIDPLLGKDKETSSYKISIAK
jgi:hypothetical protein